MRRFVTLASTSILWIVMTATVPVGAETLRIVGGQYFDLETVRPNPGVLVRAGRIQAVGDLPAPGPGDRTLKLAKGEVLLPGFIDLHAHYNLTLHETRREEFVGMPALYLANGATTTFPAGSYAPDEMIAMRQRIDRGEQAGPRVLNSGPYFGPARPGWDAEMDPDSLRAEIDHWAERGGAGIKVKRISAPQFAVVVERAHRHGLTVTGHLDSGYRNTINPRDAIALGIDRVEHFLGGDAMPPDRSAYDSFPDVQVDSDEFRDIVALFLEHRVYFNATLSAYGYFGDLKVVSFCLVLTIAWLCGSGLDHVPASSQLRTRARGLLALAEASMIRFILVSKFYGPGLIVVLGSGCLSWWGPPRGARGMPVP